LHFVIASNVRQENESSLSSGAFAEFLSDVRASLPGRQMGTANTLSLSLFPIFGLFAATRVMAAGQTRMWMGTSSFRSFALFLLAGFIAIEKT
jgi:hypothetical protein